MTLKSWHFIFTPSLITALVVLAPVPAFAGPPYQTDDPETVEYQHWEFYIASQYRHDKDGDTATLPHVEINYGVIPNVQLHLIVPLVYNSPSGEASHYGLGDVELGVKFRFIQESEWIPMVGTFPFIEIPTGNQNEGLGNGKAQYFIPLWLQKSWGPWTSYGGGGYWINPGDGNKDWWFWGWQVQREISKALAVGAELIYRTADVDNGDNSFGYNIGAVININENHHLLFSAGSDISGPNRFSCYVGYQFTFGPEGK
ncbi:MAG TPA: transporter [Syntrophales bacterium]|nr:transporter [Syntrophales bacterium]